MTLDVYYFNRHTPVMDSTRTSIDTNASVATDIRSVDFESLAQRIIAEGGELADIATEILRINESLSRLSQRAVSFITR